MGRFIFPRSLPYDRGEPRSRLRVPPASVSCLGQLLIDRDNDRDLDLALVDELADHT